MNEVELIIAKTYKANASRLLAVLTGIFGAHNFAMAEDVLQEAFSKALIHWQHEIPQNPEAWIIRTAKNKAIDTIRANKTRINFADNLDLMLESEWSLGATVEQEFDESNIKDDQLRMIFVCCHETIKLNSRIPFILKTLCGFSISAIARALLVPEQTISKRLYRTKEKLRDIKFDFPSPDKRVAAMDTVHTVLYLLFNEGFHSSSVNRAVHIEFCQEAIGLVDLLIDEPRIANRILLL